MFTVEPTNLQPVSLVYLGTCVSVEDKNANFIYFPLAYLIKTLQKVVLYTWLTSCTFRLYPNIVIVEEFVKIYFVTVSFHSLRVQGYNTPKHLIGLDVIVEYFIIIFYLYFSHIILKLTCLSNNGRL